MLRRDIALILLLGLAGGVSRGASSALFQPAPGSPIAVGTQPTGITIADVNGDGKLDILTANSRSNDVIVLLGDGRAGFRPAPGSPFAAGPHPHLLALGDVNGDQKLDLAVTEHDSNEVRLFFGSGDGRFRVAPGSPFATGTGKPHNHGLSFADVNADGKLDIVTSNQNAKSVSALLGDGKGSFTASAGSPFSAGGSPYPHAIGDINGDGAPDIITPNVQENTMGVLLGDGKGGFRMAPGAPIRVAFRPYHSALADVNGDGHLDAVLSHDDITLLSVLLGDGNGGFSAARGSPVDLRARGGMILLRDANGDGLLDIIISSINGVHVLLGDGRGGFAPAPGSPFPAGRGPWSLGADDLNGDGKLDIVTANSESNSVTVLLGR
jgi:hypothetical protein